MKYRITSAKQITWFPLFTLVSSLFPPLSIKFCKNKLNYHSQEILPDDSITSWIFFQIPSYIPLDQVLGTLGKIPGVHPWIDACFQKYHQKNSNVTTFLHCPRRNSCNFLMAITGCLLCTAYYPKYFKLVKHNLCLSFWVLPTKGTFFVPILKRKAKSQIISRFPNVTQQVRSIAHIETPKYDRKADFSFVGWDWISWCKQLTLALIDSEPGV